MDFKKWWENNGEFREPTVSDRDAFEAGQQSKQAEIDALQKRINDALNEIESGITGKHHVKRIINILKGELK